MSKIHNSAQSESSFSEETRYSRRTFLKGTLSAAAVATTVSTTSALASNHASMAGIVYTKENPGKWAKKIGGHLPSITIEGSKVTVNTDHGMSAKHYIVRHTLVSKNGEVIGEKTFTPDDDDAISSYTLPDSYKGALYASSFCNKHDFWLAETDV